MGLNMTIMTTFTMAVRNANDTTQGIKQSQLQGHFVFGVPKAILRKWNRETLIKASQSLGTCLYRLQVMTKTSLVNHQP